MLLKPQTKLKVKLTNCNLYKNNCNKNKLGIRYYSTNIKTNTNTNINTNTNNNLRKNNKC